MSPLTAEEFATLMGSLAPFEPKPKLAVALSGGADSLALTLLLKDWLDRRGGSLLALTVDHGLRRGSAAEARQVAALMEARGIPHQVLRWRGEKPTASPQAAARQARYRLLGQTCQRRDILHLCLAHHLEDQAETLLLRLGRGSGLEGLAAMAPVVETAELRLLRPLLTVSRERLTALLQTRGCSWIEDPSNRETAFARVRLRRMLPQLAREGLTAERLGAAAGHLGRARAALEPVVAALLARAVRPDPAGFLTLAPVVLAEAPREASLRALARCLMTVGGSGYTPRLDRLERLHGKLAGGLGPGATLAGCRILRQGSRWLLVREAGRSRPGELEPGRRLLWDGRFELAAARRRGGAAVRLRVTALGAGGWRQLLDRLPPDKVWRARRLPAAARAALPAISDPQGLVAVPPLGYFRDAAAAKGLSHCRFAPTNGLTGGSFTVV